MNENEQFIPPEQKRTVSWNELIDPQRPIPVEYTNLIEHQEEELHLGSLATIIDTPYAEQWSFLVQKEDIEYSKIPATKDTARGDSEKLDLLFQEKLKNGTLVDLGGGQGFMMGIARTYKMSSYIKIDRNSGYALLCNDGSNDKNRPVTPLIANQDVEWSGLRLIGVKADMLDCVSRLRPRTIHFTLNGIDTYIIGTIAYHKALAQEILRVSQCGSLIFGVSSEALELLSEYAAAEGGRLQEHHFGVFNGMMAGDMHVLEVIK